MHTHNIGLTRVGGKTLTLRFNFKDEAKEERASRRRGQGRVKTSNLEISTRNSVHAIINPMGNKR